MTLVVGLMNQENAFLVSDRLVSRKNRVVCTEFNKAVVMCFSDARVAMGFSGNAAVMGDTTRWILQIFPAIENNRYLEPSLVGLCNILNGLRCIGDTVVLQEFRLSLLFVGYCYDNGKWRGIIAMISNFESLENQGIFEPTEFRLTYVKSLDSRARYKAISVIGSGSSAVSAKAQTDLMSMLDRGSPSTAIVNKTIDVIRSVAKLKAFSNQVGKQCTSVTIPSSPNSDISCYYHSSKRSYYHFGPDFISADNDGLSMYSGINFYGKDEKGALVYHSFGNVPRNAPCPCGSGKKYKHCHNRMNPTGRSH